MNGATREGQLSAVTKVGLTHDRLGGPPLATLGAVCLEATVIPLHRSQVFAMPGCRGQALEK